jgi:hypothetical protein
MFDNIDIDNVINSDAALDLTNNNMADHNIVPISTLGTFDISTTPSSNMTETIPRIRLVDIINSTYTAPADIDDEELDRFIRRSVGDRIDDVLHTVVSSNATIVPTATIRNNILNQISTTNDTNVFTESLEGHLVLALERIRTISQPANDLLELHTDIEAVCIANNTSLAECDINIIIR